MGARSRLKVKKALEVQASDFTYLLRDLIDNIKREEGYPGGLEVWAFVNGQNIEIKMSLGSEVVVIAKNRCGRWFLIAQDKEVPASWSRVARVVEEKARYWLRLWNESARR